MKFFCEYCGVRIDTNKDNKCPSCGASYKKNKTFIRMQEEQNQKREEVENFVRNTFNMGDASNLVSKTFKGVGIMKIVVGIIFALVFCSIVFGFISMAISQTSGFKNGTKKPVIVDTDVHSETPDYEVKVTGYEKVEDKFRKAREGYEIIRFDLTVENKTNDRLIRQDVNCIVDGIAQTNEFSSGYSTIPMFISPNLTVKGDATFIVPKDATSYDIRYGDNITIHIEK